jgi:hypothetical protein
MAGAQPSWRDSILVPEKRDSILVPEKRDSILVPDWLKNNSSSRSSTGSVASIEHTSPSREASASPPKWLQRAATSLSRALCDDALSPEMTSHIKRKSYAGDTPPWLQMPSDVMTSPGRRSPDSVVNSPVGQCAAQQALDTWTSCGEPPRRRSPVLAAQFRFLRDAEAAASEHTIEAGEEALFTEAPQAAAAARAKKPAWLRMTSLEMLFAKSSDDRKAHRDLGCGLCLFRK